MSQLMYNSLGLAPGVVEDVVSAVVNTSGDVERARSEGSCRERGSIENGEEEGEMSFGFFVWVAR